MKTVLITGAAGRVGCLLRRELAGRYRLRLSDVRVVDDLVKGERFAKANLARPSDAMRIARGVDAIVHLGGYSVEGPWPAILEANIVGSYHLFEAARRVGVTRVVFASSHHVVGFHPRDEVVDHRADVRPDSRYAASKVFGEALGRLYVDKYGLEVFCVRIGNVHPFPLDERRLSIWSSPRDLAQLVSIGIDHPGVKFEIVYGVSDNRRSWYDNSNATRLGYRPQDDAEVQAAEVLARAPAGGRNGKTGGKGNPKDGGNRKREGMAIEERYQGGPFTVAETIANPAAAATRRRRPR